MEQQQSPAAPPPTPPAPAPMDASTAAQTMQTHSQLPTEMADLSQSLPSQDLQPLLPPIQQLANHLAQQDQGPGQASPQNTSTATMQQPQHQAHQQQQQHYQHAQHPAQYPTQHPTPPLQQHQYDLPPPTLNGAPPMQHAQHQQQQPSTPTHYTYPPAQPQNGDANGFPSQMRYSMPLPPNQMDARQLSGGRHKKEIKRRTKTGCLTCRKRRIKVSMRMHAQCSVTRAARTRELTWGFAVRRRTSQLSELPKEQARMSRL